MLNHHVYRISTFLLLIHIVAMISLTCDARADDHLPAKSRRFELKISGESR